MSTLTVSNGYRTLIPGLGRYRGLGNLSKKRVSIAVRNKLRQEYGLANVEVSCEPEPTPNGWSGSCKIFQDAFHYTIERPEEFGKER